MTAPAIRARKGSGHKIVCLTAYDFPSARIAEAAGVDVVLVGDSLGNTVLGYDSTIPVTMDEVAHHLRAVRRGLEKPLLVADLPFGSYNASVAAGVDAAVRFMKDGAEAVKLEGDYPEVIAAMVKAGVPVMGHVGFTPQSVHRFGGHRVQGKGDEAEAVVATARRIQDAGAFSIVVELVPAALARELTTELSIPTVGIGAGPDCDGEIQVFHDVMGLSERVYRHAKAYTKGLSAFSRAAKAYAQEVRDGTFPGPENSV
ncbi:MAG: 3-methyl-2-oxobutanoate hydroxymethyltransferase [Fimbriimonadaceae bacterium]|nr:3-methyl-2-oxobutanoate hydroxymethyltransferase [Fimbriimonadaceae bacterium]